MLQTYRQASACECEFCKAHIIQEEPSFAQRCPSYHDFWHPLMVSCAIGRKVS